MRIHANEIDAPTLDALREKDAAQLKADLQTLRASELDQRFQKAFGQLENTAQRNRTRKNIARVLTVIREKQIQHFLLTDSEVQKLLTSGNVALSAGKNDASSAISRGDLEGTDARSVTLSMRLWSRLRKNEDFFRRTQQIPKI